MDIFGSGNDCARQKQSDAMPAHLHFAPAFCHDTLYARVPTGLSRPPPHVSDTACGVNNDNRRLHFCQGIRTVIAPLSQHSTSGHHFIIALGALLSGTRSSPASPRAPDGVWNAWHRMVPEVHDHWSILHYICNNSGEFALYSDSQSGSCCGSF